MSVINHNGETYYPVSRILTELVPPAGKTHFQFSLLLSSPQSNFNTVYLKSVDYLAYQTKLNNLMRSQKTLTKDSIQVLSSILDRLFLESPSGDNISQFISYLPLMFEMNSNLEFKKLFSESLLSPNAKSSFNRAMVAQNLAVKMNNSSNYFLSRLLTASYFCDYIDSDEPQFHSLQNAALLESIPAINSEVILAIKHHHEYNDGSGFLKLKNASIHPLAKYIRFADELCSLQGKSAEVFNERIQFLQFKIDAPLLRLIKKP